MVSNILIQNHLDTKTICQGRKMNKFLLAGTKHCLFILMFVVFTVDGCGSTHIFINKQPLTPMHI